MAYEIKMYIGQNNDSKKCEYKKAETILYNYNIDGFNVNRNEQGYWKGDKEKCFSITIIDDSNRYVPIMRKVRKDLEVALKQYLILTTIKKIDII